MIIQMSCPESRHLSDSTRSLLSSDRYEPLFASGSNVLRVLSLSRIDINSAGNVDGAPLNIGSVCKGKETLLSETNSAKEFIVHFA